MSNSPIGRIRAHFSKPANSVSPDFEDVDIDVWRSRDHETNERTSLPDCESIDLCCVWGVEFYGPSHVEALIGAFEDLNWGSRHEGNPHHDPVSWLRDLRRYRTGGAFMNLGVLTRSESEGFWAPSRTTVALPSCIDYASAYMYQLSASLIAIVACFVLKEDDSNAFDSILLEERRTLTRPIKRGVSIHDPASQKAEDIGRVRKDLSSAIAQWFQEHLPGQFSSSTRSGELPTCEFLTTRQARPFPPISEGRPSGFSYVGLLEMDYGFDVWKSDSISGLCFKESTSIRHHSIIAAREQDIVAEMRKGYHKDRSGRIFYIDQVVRSVILARAILMLFEEYTQSVLRVRDADLSRASTSKGAVEYLDKLTRNVLYGADVSAVAEEIPSTVQAGFGPLGDASDFSSVELFGRASVSYAEQFRMIIADHARWLQTLEHAFSAYSTQVGSLLGTRENVRLQRHMTWMTIALLVLTVVTVVIAVVNG